MPKIIEDAGALIFEAARRKLSEKGENFSLRGIAKECGISPGTVYNYYSDKSSLIEAVMKEDWEACERRISERCLQAGTMQEAAEVMTEEMKSITGRYRNIITADDMTETRFNPYGKRHSEVLECLSRNLEETSGRLGIVLSGSQALVLGEMISACAQQPEISAESVAALVACLNL